MQSCALCRAVIPSSLMMPEDVHTKTQRCLLKVLHTKTLSQLWQWRLSLLGSLDPELLLPAAVLGWQLCCRSPQPWKSHTSCARALTTNIEHRGMRLMQEQLFQQPWWPWAVATGRGMVAQGHVVPARSDTDTGALTARNHST